jgi:sporulation protein YlmC with PRC-barrel domain
MKVSGDIDIALGILDHQLHDADGRRCGKVDDLELAGISEGRPVVEAIVTGPGAWRGRGLLGRAAAALTRGRTVRVSWDEVAEVGAGVGLRRTAAELRLARGEDWARRWVERIPGASL